MFKNNNDIKKSVNKEPKEQKENNDKKNESKKLKLIHETDEN